MSNPALEAALELQRLDPAARAARLAAIAANDAAFADTLRGLLAGLEAATVGGEAPELGEALAPPERIARYRILGTLGEGGMGTVYLARQDQPEREVALKVIRSAGDDPEVLARFRLEAEALARLEHPGIARIYEAGSSEIGGRRLPWLAMEYVRGPDLMGHVRSAGPDLRARLRLLIDLSRAVHHAHGQGVIHRDLKPQNILVDAHGQPRILDFGVARFEREGQAMTRAGQVVGTLGYMSPEQLGGLAAQADARSDVYALGVIAYEVLSGSLPYPDLASSSLIEALDRVRRSDPEPLGKADPALRGDIETVVMKALAADPARRYDSAAALADDIERVLAHLPILARPPTPWYLFSRFARRHRVLVAAAAMVLLALLAAVAVSLDFALGEAEARREAEVRAAEAQAVSDFVSDMLTSADPEKALGRDIRVAEVLDSAALELERDLDLPESVRARLFTLLGTVRLQQGEIDAAIGLLESAGELAGDDQELADDVLATLSLAHSMRGESERAEALVRGRLAALPKPLPESEIGLRSVLVRTAYELGRVQEAEDDYRALLLQSKELLGAEHEATLTIGHNLSSVLQKQAKYGEALTFSREVIEVRKRVYGPDHPQTLHSRNLHAILLFHSGDRAGAGEEFRAVLEARRRTLGENHPSTWVSEQSLGAQLIEAGQLEEGTALVRRALTRLDERLGPGHNLTLTGRDSLARGLELLGRVDEAEVLLREIIALKQAGSDAPRAEVLLARNNLAMLMLENGRAAEALPELDRVVADSIQVFGADHPYVAIFRGNRGQCLAALDRLQEAVEAFETSLQTLRATMGDEHARTRKVADQLAAARLRLAGG